MNKSEFLKELEKELIKLDEKERRSSLDFYGEIIDDKIESGMSEEEAVSQLGSVSDIARQTMLDLPLQTLIKSKCKVSRKMRAWEIVLIVLGSPVWLGLGLALLGIIISIYAVIWSLWFAVWSVELSLFLCSFAGILKFALVLGSQWQSALIYLGMSLLVLGLSGILFLPCVKLTKAFAKLSVGIVKFIKFLIVGKEKEK